MSSSNGSAGPTLPPHSERPERSRNAKAQARHRAKRKAYIEQLEQTVTKLQTALGFSPEQVAALPPPLVKIRELEQENARLNRENEDLRRMLQDPDRGHRTSLPALHDSRAPDRDLKRRKMAGNGDEVYMGSANSSHELLRPPPLTIPQPVSHHYSSMTSQHGSHGGSSSSSMFTLQAPAYDTPSGSSSTSSPPFSPAQMPPSTHSPAHHRPNPLPNHHGLSNYTPSNHHQYGHGVKTEDEHYVSSQHRSHSGQYSTQYPPFSQVGPEHQTDNWHGYSSERAHLHR